MDVGSKAYQRKVNRKSAVDVYAPLTENEKRIDNSKPVQHYPSMAEKVAKSTIYVKNWYIPQAIHEFPFDDRMKRIDKFFPYAVGGPLLVDEPSDAKEADKCHAKALKAKAWGYRYIVLEMDTDLFNALTQLGEI